LEVDDWKQKYEQLVTVVQGFERASSAVFAAQGKTKHRLDQLFQ
jgi:hypothetical protein